ncbi:MAG: hypothetical protein K6E59_02700 [Bacilli bacterium]|nr:hypothetical protein [Bacilli bacterium]
MAEKKKKIPFVSKLTNAIFSRRGVVINGILGLGLFAWILALLIIPARVCGDPGAYGDPQFIALREKTLQEGTRGGPNNSGLSGDDTSRWLDVNVNGSDYFFLVWSPSVLSHYFEISTSVVLAENVNAIAAFSNELILPTSDELAQGMVFEGTAELANAKGYPLFWDKGIYASTKARSKIDDKLREYPDTTLENPKDSSMDDATFQGYADQALALRSKLLQDIPDVLRQLGATEPSTLLSGAVRIQQTIVDVLGLPAQSILLSVPCGPLLCLFAVGWVRLLMEDKRHRLVSRGELPPIRRAELYPCAIIEPDPPEVVEEPKEPIVSERQKAYERFIERTKLRPIFGEWFFRALGLLLIAIGVTLTFFATKAASGIYGDAGYAFASGAEWYETIEQAGRFILVIGIIGVTCETHRNLKFSSAVFFSLAFIYYLTANSILLFIDYSMPMESSSGFSLGSVISNLLPGNIFLGIGLFAFIGFFLFSNPPKWFINRTAFRALSAIPTAIAILSIVFSALFRAGVYTPNYWIKNILFIRDFDAIFIGVSYEFVIFFHRRHMIRKYGEEGIDERIAQPSHQFLKNLILCGLIVAFTIFFYSVTGDWKKNLDLPKHTFIYFLIPLFLFYKPAGVNHNNKLDILYYGLYFLGMLLPKILNLIVS